MRSIGPRDAVLTGTGAITALGYGLEAGFEALAGGASGIRETGDAEPSSGRGLAARVEPPFLRAPVPEEMEAQIKFLNGSGELAVEATIEAAAQAGLLDSAIAPEMRGLYLSQMDSGDWDCMEFRPAVVAATEGFEKALEAEALNRAANRFVKPFFMLESLKNNAFSFLATMFELRGANTSLAGLAGPTHEAIDLGVRSLARGTLDVALVVGAARISTAVARIEARARGVSGTSPDELVPGDGAGALVMERREDAAARGARALAAVLGTGTCTRPAAAGTWAPQVETLCAAADLALRAAGAAPGDLLGVVAPGIGETGLREALDELPAASGAPLVSWKRATGHMALAGDVVEAALACRALSAEGLPGAGSAGSGSSVLLLTAGLQGQAGALVLAPATAAK